MKNPRINPAYGQQCKKCGKENPFAAKCKQKESSSWQKKKVHYVHEREESDEEYCFTVSMKNQVNTMSKHPFKSKILATMEVEGKPVRFQVDSGATCNIIPRKDLPSNCKIGETEHRLTMYNGTDMKVTGKCLVHLVNPKNGKKYQAEFIIVDEDTTPLLGSRTVQQMNLVKVQYENIAVVQQPKELTKQELVKEYEDVFTGEGQFEKKLHLEIDTSARPVRQPLRRVPLAMKPKLKEELNRLEKIGVIKRVDTPTDWVSSLVIVKKPNGKLRICIDPKPLNQTLKRSHYPLPVVDNILPELAKAKVFSVCDVKNGFWHVELDQESSYLTTFGTPFGRYRWLKMPFGISPAPEYFQSTLDQAIENLPGVKTIVDDILIYGEGETQEEAIRDHDQKLLKLLQRCREKGITLNKEKFKMKLTEIPYIGDLLTQNGLKPDPSKVEAILNMSKPTDLKAVQRLVGMVNYLTNFLKKLADICEPLRQLTRKEIECQWTEVHDVAFEKIKEAVTTRPVLRYFNANEETVLQCDASGNRLGASLKRVNLWPMPHVP